MEKTCYTVFSPTKIKSPSINLTLNGNKLEQVTTGRYLGVLLLMMSCGGFPI